MRSTTSSDELNRNYHRVDGYPLKEKLGKARERAGTSELLLEIADDELILGWRDSEWTGIAPFLEEDVAFSSIAQNEIGHARALYELAARDLGTTADELAFDRKPEEYRCCELVELRLAGVGADDRTARLYEQADAERLERLKASDDAEVAGLAAKIDREEAYHRLHAEMWHERLQERAAVRRGAGGAAAAARPEGRSHAGAGAALGGDDQRAPLAAAGTTVVTEAQVWEALAEVPDPRSRSSLSSTSASCATCRSGRARPRRIHADVPRVPRARGDARSDGRANRRARRRAGVEVVLDDSWSTDRITPEGREKLRAAGFAPPAPREAGGPKLVQLQSNGFRCPYCGSQDTALENIFGPTPCRSLRYCRDCKQPFEQFKTI